MIRDLGRILSAADRWTIAGLVVLMLGGALIEALGIGVILPFLTLVAMPDPVRELAWLRQLHELVGAPAPQQFVLGAALAVLALYWLKGLYLASLYACQARFVYGKETELAKRLLEGCLEAPYDAVAARNSTGLVHAIASETNRVANGVLMPLLVLASESLVLLALAGLLVVLQPLAALGGLALFAAAGMVAHLLLGPTVSRARQERLRSHAAMFRWASESLSAMKEIRVFGRAGYFADAFRRHSDTHSRANRTFWYLGLVPRLLVEVLGATAIILVLLVALSAGRPPHEVLPLLAVFALAVVRMIPSTTRLVSAVNSLRFFTPSLRLVCESLYAPSAPVPAPAEREPFSRLELRAVSYRYPGASSDALSGIDLTIHRGEMVAISGASGAGKTTLIDLLLGLLRPAAGEILVNGRAESSLLRGRRLVVGLVPQRFHLLDDSLRRNVAFGVPDERIDDAKVREALRLARVEGLASRSPLGLDLSTGEHGEALSGGEGQRVCIARALYVNPDILVFDEATSALDREAEAGILDTLRSLAAERTVLLVTHREASLRACDRALVLKDGALAEDADPSEVAALAVGGADLTAMRNG